MYTRGNSEIVAMEEEEEEEERKQTAFELSIRSQEPGNQSQRASDGAATAPSLDFLPNIPSGSLLSLPSPLPQPPPSRLIHLPSFIQHSLGARSFVFQPSIRQVSRRLTYRLAFLLLLLLPPQPLLSALPHARSTYTHTHTTKILLLLLACCSPRNLAKRKRKRERTVSSARALRGFAPASLCVRIGN